MAKSYSNILTFLFTTLFYYLALKPTLTYTEAGSSEALKTYTNKNNLYLAIYLLSVIIIQFIVNAYSITYMCGGSVKDNIYSAIMFTFVPWTLIFGVLIVILVLYPGIKSAFSDIIGYFYVSDSAKKLLTELLMDSNSLVSVGNTQQQQVTESISKILNDPSTFINKIVPINFNEYWNLLTPLMKPQFINAGVDVEPIKNKFFELVVTRDNIGEAMWFIYTGFLITTIVNLKITKNGCVKNPTTMIRNYNKFLEKEDKKESDNKKSTKVVYTLDN